MAQIVLNIPDAKITEVVDGIAAYFNYSQTKLPGETKGEFAKRKVIEFAKKAYQEGIAGEVGQTAYQQSISETSTTQIT